MKERKTPRNQYPLMSRDQMSQPQKIHLWGGQERENQKILRYLQAEEDSEEEPWRAAYVVMSPAKAARVHGV